MEQKKNMAHLVPSTRNSLYPSPKKPLTRPALLPFPGMYKNFWRFPLPSHFDRMAVSESETLFLPTGKIHRNLLWLTNWNSRRVCWTAGKRCPALWHQIIDTGSWRMRNGASSFRHCILHKILYFFRAMHFYWMSAYVYAFWKTLISLVTVFSNWSFFQSQTWRKTKHRMEADHGESCFILDFFSVAAMVSHVIIIYT